MCLSVGEDNPLIRIRRFFHLWPNAQAAKVLVKSSRFISFCTHSQNEFYVIPRSNFMAIKAILWMRSVFYGSVELKCSD